MKHDHAPNGIPKDDGSHMHIGRRLRKLRHLSGITVSEVATRLGFKINDILILEESSDLAVSTLRSYLSALGASLHIFAEFANSSETSGDLQSEGIIFDRKNKNQLLFPVLQEAEVANSRAVVFSIKPHYSRDILSGKKTVELRRRFPASIPKGATAVIYETSPTCALSGIAEISKVNCLSVSEVWSKFSSRSCISRELFDRYFDGTNTAFAIELVNPRALDRQINLQELRERFGFTPPQSYLYASNRLKRALVDDKAQILN